MSWYTYFYPPKEAIAPKEDFLSKDIKDIITDIKLTMIDAYYNHDKFSVKVYMHQFINDYYTNSVEDCHRIWSEQLKEYNSVAFNHLNVNSKEDAEDKATQCKDRVSDYITDMLVLSRIHFNPDSTEDKTEMDYLRYTYISEIDDILNNLKDTIDEQIKYEFVGEFYDTAKNEE